MEGLVRPPALKKPLVNKTDEKIHRSAETATIADAMWSNSSASSCRGLTELN